MADALVLLVTASIFLSGFLSVRIHQDLDRATDATDKFDRRVRRWVRTFREVDTDKAVAPFIELAAGLRPDPVLRLTAAANAVFAVCVTAVVAYWAIDPAGNTMAVPWVVGGAALLVQVVVLALFEYDRNRVSDDFRGQLESACDSIVHLAPYLFAPHSMRLASTLTLRESITEARGSIQIAARHNSGSRFRVRHSEESSAVAQEFALVQRWLLMMVGDFKDSSSAPRAEQREKPVDVRELRLRIAGHLLDATEAKLRESRLHMGMDVNAHLVKAARDCHEFNDSFDGVAWDAICWALAKENCGDWDLAHQSIGVFYATGETAATEQAAAGLHTILGEYLAGRRTQAEVEERLGEIRSPKTGSMPPERYTTLAGALHWWVKIEMRLRDDEHDTARRARALLLAEELDRRVPAADDVDVDRELRLLGASEDAHIAERMWLHLVRGQVVEATDIAKEANLMNSVVVEQPLMTLAWAWLHFQSEHVENAEILIRLFASSPHVDGNVKRRNTALERVRKVVTRHGVSNESFRKFSDLVKQAHSEEVPSTAVAHP